jgi:hypothetical protein
MWNAFCVLSLLLFLLGTAIWVRSLWVTADFERFSRSTDHGRNPPLTRTLGWGIGWGTGTLGFFHYRGESSVPRQHASTWIYREFGPTRNLLTAATSDDRVNLRAGSFQLLYRIERSVEGWQSLRLMVVPLWTVMATVIPPLVWVRGRRRRRSRILRTSAVDAVTKRGGTPTL